MPESARWQYDDFEIEVLGMGTEDAFGLYEVRWRANSVLPWLPEADRRSWSHRAVSRHLATKRITLCRKYDGTDALDWSEAMAPLEGDDAWNPGTDASLWYFATETGVREIERLTESGYRTPAGPPKSDHP